MMDHLTLDCLVAAADGDEEQSRIAAEHSAGCEHCREQLARVLGLAEAAADEDFVLTRAHLEAWEGTHGPIPPRHWIMLRTDWSKRVGTPGYLNMQKDGPHSPGPDAGAMEFLVQERDCIGLAVETIGTDAGQAAHFTPPFPAHAILHGNGRYGLQCLRNLDRLPVRGALIVACPLKIEGGSGSPLRVIALVSRGGA
jgi:kynurenine formamidase